MFTKHPLYHLYNTNTNYFTGITLNSKTINIVPRCKKLVLTLSSTNLNLKYLEDFFGLLYLLTKQKPHVCRSKKLVVFFKIKKNQLIGFKVTLRRYYMFDFLLNFISLILPLDPFFNGYFFNSTRGCISFTYKKFIFFPELNINPDYIINNHIFPKLNLTLHSTAQSKYALLVLLRNLQIPWNIPNTN